MLKSSNYCVLQWIKEPSILLKFTKCMADKNASIEQQAQCRHGAFSELVISFFRTHLVVPTL